MNYVICVRNRDYEASLELRKLYTTVPDEEAARQGQIRVIDESGDDYLYPAGCFVEVELSEDVKKAVSSVA